MRSLVLCVGCGELIDPESFQTYRKVSGWEKRRTTGGTNALSLRVQLDEWMCEVCMGKSRRGLDPGQMALA